jgi:hypothetical protein
VHQPVEEAVRLPDVGNPGKCPVLPRQAHPRLLERERKETCLPLGETTDLNCPSR